jgi:O-methyltransferase
MHDGENGWARVLVSRVCRDHKAMNSENVVYWSLAGSSMIKTAMKWLGSSAIASAPRRYVGKMLDGYYLTRGRALTRPYGTTSDFHPHEPEAFELIRQIKAETQMLLSELEAFQIYSAVTKTAKLDGDIAEVGVYKGGSAKLISETTTKPVHLFDTFEGLPDVSQNDNPEEFRKGDYSASLESVKSYLRKYPNVHFYVGFFPSTAGPVENKKFSFIHLDVDIYESTLSCLKFFYPRMASGGVIISHDYPKSKGVQRAVDGFFEDKPEIVIELPACGQCLIVKT